MTPNRVIVFSSMHTDNASCEIYDMLTVVMPKYVE